MHGISFLEMKFASICRGERVGVYETSLHVSRGASSSILYPIYNILLLPNLYGPDFDPLFFHFVFLRAIHFLHTSNAFLTKMRFLTFMCVLQTHQIFKFNWIPSSNFAPWNSAISHLRRHSKWSIQDVELHSATFPLKSQWGSNYCLVGPSKKTQLFKKQQ